MRILLVEDHADLQELVRSQLVHWGFAADAVGSGRAAVAKLQWGPYDAVILDLGLPDMDGTQVLRALGHGPARTACLVLTARDGVGSRVEALNAGADDYLVKPFDMAELQARLRAILRRSKGQGMGELALGDLRFDPISLQLWVREEVVDLSRKEAMLAEELLRVAPRLVVRNRLEDSLYAAHESVSANALEALVSRLRRKLQSHGSQVQIGTVRGVGYRLHVAPPRSAGGAGM